MHPSCPSGNLKKDLVSHPKEPDAKKPVFVSVSYARIGSACLSPQRTGSTKMLTTTYSIIALSGEQQRARRMFRELEQSLREQRLHQRIRSDSDSADLACLRTIHARLVLLDRSCHRRKVETCIVPAVREACAASADARPLLARLDALSADMARILRYLHVQMQRAVDGDAADVEMLITAMQLYCERMLARLFLEEAELLPLACRLLPVEEWLRIAACCRADAAARHTAFKRGHAACLRSRRRPPRMAH